MNEDDTVRQESNATPRPKRRRRWVLPVLFVVVLACGFVVGASVVAMTISYRIQRHVRHPNDAPARITRRLTEKLDLTEEQAVRVEDILVQTHESLRQIRKEVRPRINEVLDANRKQISEVLTEEQAQKWKEMHRRLYNKWMGGPPRRRHGPGGP